MTGGAPTLGGIRRFATVTVQNLIVTGTLTASGTGSITGATTITASNANALAVGPNGTTNPTLKIVTNASSAATGISITAAAAASGVALAAISSGTDENLTINAKGSGTVTINGTATGNIVLGRATTGVSLSVTGALTARSGTATPAAASAVAALLFSSTANLGIYWGTGSPNTALTAAQGSLYLATDGSSSSTRAFINSNGTTGWVAVTTAS